jgi:CelD/BcsL family acetyltransferase involved in cellulose biosynthesis
VSFTVRCDGRELTALLVESAEDLAALREPWTTLFAASTSDSAFQTWEWMDSWSERFVRGSRRLFVVTVFDGPELIGLAPWYIDRVSHGPVRARQVAFLGLPEGGSDYLDVITRKGKERLVADALVQLLFGPLSSRWDLVRLNDIPAESSFLARFVAQLRRSGKHYAIDEGAYCPGIYLPESFEAYLGQLSGHGRQAFRRKMRGLLANTDVNHTMLREERDVAHGLVKLRELYEKRWGRTRESSDLFAVMTGYVSRSAAAWRIELSLLTVQERLIAGLLHFTRGRTMCQYLMAVDRTFNPSISVGTLICGMNIDAAIQAGYTEYDFLKTEEDYKLQLTNRGRRSLNLRLHNKTVRSLSVWTIQSANALAKILFR